MENPLDAISRTLGDEQLAGRLSVNLADRVGSTRAVISETGNLVVTSYLPDGVTSYFLDVWAVAASSKAAVLALLLEERFPDGPPFSAPSARDSDEILLRLLRARFGGTHDDASHVANWLKRSGIPFSYESKYQSSAFLRSESDS